MRTSSNQAVGADQCADWRIGTNSTCGFDIYRKATGSLGALYDGNVLEFDQDGDINVVKEGGLSINDVDVATETVLRQYR